MDSARRAQAPSPKSSRKWNLGLLRHPKVALVGQVGTRKTPRGLPKHEAKHKAGHTKEVGARLHEEPTQGWGALVLRDANVDGRMGPRRGALVSFGLVGPLCGATHPKDAMIC
jgi:hypothetical protein